MGLNQLTDDTVANWPPQLDQDDLFQPIYLTKCMHILNDITVVTFLKVKNHLNTMNLFV